MTVWGNRTDTPGFFTPCRQCPCGKEVAAELAAEKARAHLAAQTDTNLDTQENR